MVAVWTAVAAEKVPRAEKGLSGLTRAVDGVLAAAVHAEGVRRLAEEIVLGRGEVDSRGRTERRGEGIVCVAWRSFRMAAGRAAVGIETPSTVVGPAVSRISSISRFIAHHAVLMSSFCQNRRKCSIFESVRPAVRHHLVGHHPLRLSRRV